MIRLAAGEDLRFPCEATEGARLHHAFAVTLETGSAKLRSLRPLTLQQCLLCDAAHTACAQVIAGVNWSDRAYGVTFVPAAFLASFTFAESRRLCRLLTSSGSMSAGNERLYSTRARSHCATASFSLPCFSNA